MCGSDAAPTAHSSTPACLQPAASPDVAVDGDLVVEHLPITFDGHTYPHGRIAYVKGRPPVPAVLVHHNYAGLKQFDIDQACFLARAGYVGVAVDLYKERPDYKYGDRSPTSADSGEHRTACFKNAFGSMRELHVDRRAWRDLMAAFLEAAFAHPAVAEGRAGAMGYCLGGQSCLEQLRGGHQIQAMVSLHGLLQVFPSHGDPIEGMRPFTKEELAKINVPPTTCTPGCLVVIENGALDDMVTEASIRKWMAEMDEQRVDWRFNNHARTPHGWALPPWCPGGGENYREKQDRRSTKNALATFAEAWPDVKQCPVEVNACGTVLGSPSLSPSSMLAAAAPAPAARL